MQTELGRELGAGRITTEEYRRALRNVGLEMNDLARERVQTLESGIGNISDAFGDFVSRGFKDFKGFASSILDSFKSMISQMVSMAARNEIMFGLGLRTRGGAAAGALNGGRGLLGGLFGGGRDAGGGGPLGGALGGVGTALQGFIGSFGAGDAAGSGLLGGLGASLSGGLGGVFNIGANAAAAGGGLAASLGAAVPVIGAVGLAVAAFRSKTKQLDAGLQVNINGMDTLVQSFKTVEKSRFFGLSKKVHTSLEAVDQSTQDGISAAMGTLQSGVIDAAGALGFGGRTFEGFAHTMRVSLQGLEGAARDNAIQNALTGAGDAMAAMVPELTSFAHTGEGAAATLTRLSTSLQNTNTWMDTLGLRLFNTSLEGADAASTFVNLLGGIEGFNSSAQFFFQNFFSETERMAQNTKILRQEFRALNLGALPQSRDQFRALVERMRAIGNTEATAALLQMAPAFANITKQADGLIGSSQQVVNYLGDVNDWLRRVSLSTLSSSQSAQKFVNFFGTIGDFNSSAQSYFQTFFSDAERLEIKTNEVAREFANLGLGVLPNTLSSYRQIVEDASAAGDIDLVSSLMQLAPAFADIKDEANSLNSALKNNSLFKTLEDQIFAQSARGNTFSIGDVNNALTSELSGLIKKLIVKTEEGNMNISSVLARQLREVKRAAIKQETA